MEPLVVIACERTGCSRLLLLCRRCYRGQRYCGGECRKAARREQCLAAQRRYLTKLSGRRRQAAASATYRRRHAAARASPKNDIDQGVSVRRTTAYHWPCEARCARCGRPGWISETVASLLRASST